MRKLVKMLMMVAIIILLCGTSSVYSFADVLYEEDMLIIPMNLTNYKYAEIEMPDDGYVIITHEETMVKIGIDDKKEVNSVKIYGPDELKVNLSEGTHKIYLIDGAGGQFYQNDYARIHYAIYVEGTEEGKEESITKEGDYKYNEIDNKSCEIAQYIGIDDSITIPNSLGGLKVLSIGEDAFRKTKVKNVTIPRQINRIEAGAFSECRKLSSIKFETDSELEYIGEYAFAGCKEIDSICIPKRVTRIEQEAFYGCTIMNVDFESSSELNYIGKRAFEGCMIPYLILPKKLEIIDDYAFRDCFIYKVDYESKSILKRIGEGAFEGCSDLKSVKIPRDIEKIEKKTFDSCEELSGVIFQSDSKLKSIESRAFAHCAELKKISIPKNVQIIGSGAFSDCNRLTDVTFYKGCKLHIIGDNAFELCWKLKKITIPKSVKEIGKEAFAYCTSLETVKYESGIKLKKVGKNVFRSCKKLKNNKMP